MSSAINVLPTFAGLTMLSYKCTSVHTPYRHVMCGGPSHTHTHTHNTHENYHVNIIGRVCDLRVSSYGRRDNIKIHEERGGNSSITPWTLVAGAVPALNSCLLYTHVQAG